MTDPDKIKIYDDLIKEIKDKTGVKKFIEDTKCMWKCEDFYPAVE